jgi:internalin A
MTRFFVLLSLSALLFQVLPAVAVPPARTKVKSFAEWCQEKNTVPDKTRKTIDLLLKEVGTEDCQVANTKLKSTTKLGLYEREVDLQVLSAVTNLNELYLGSNKISDIKPLANLVNLTKLSLNDNQISDIKPLANLVNLTKLSLNDNQISDIKPLTKLTKLTSLDLSTNQISDIKSLVSLIELTSLSLGNNQISDVKPLSGLTKLTDLILGNNQISDIKPLAGLTKLKYLYLHRNQISDLKPLAGLNNLTTLTILPQTAPGQADTPPAPKKLVRTLEVPSRIYMTALSRDRQTLVTAEEGSITVWNLATGTSHSHTLLDREYATITALAISPDGRTLMTGSSGLDINEVSKSSGCSGWSCNWNQSSSSTKSRFGCAIQLWELNTGKGIGMLKLPTEEQINFYEQNLNFSGLKKLEFSGDGKTLSTQNKKGEILAWEYLTGERKPGLDTVYPSAKINHVIETSQNDKTTKIDIYAID